MSNDPVACADALDEQLREAEAKLEVALAFIRRIPSLTKHGPNGRGGDGLCDSDCAKCAAEAFLR